MDIFRDISHFLGASCYYHVYYHVLWLIITFTPASASAGSEYLHFAFSPKILKDHPDHRTADTRTLTFNFWNSKLSNLPLNRLRYDLRLSSPPGFNIPRPFLKFLTLYVKHYGLIYQVIVFVQYGAIDISCFLCFFDAVTAMNVPMDDIWNF